MQTLKKFFMLFGLTISLCIARPAVADLAIYHVDENQMPRELRSDDYNNSDSNYDNSAKNHRNSIENYDNSSRKWENSPSNLVNGRDGKTRLLLALEDGFYYAGYYVFSADDVLNIFDKDGTRLLYSPPNTPAIFGSRDGRYYGAIAESDRNGVFIALTSNGHNYLRGMGISFSSPSEGGDSPEHYGGVGQTLAVFMIIDKAVIVLEDGSAWEINPMLKSMIGGLRKGSQLTVMPSNQSLGTYSQLLTGPDGTFFAKYLGITSYTD